MWIWLLYGRSLLRREQVRGHLCSQRNNHVRTLLGLYLCSLRHMQRVLISLGQGRWIIHVVRASAPVRSEPARATTSSSTPIQ